METSDIIAGAALLAAMAGLAFTGMQIRYNSAVQRGMLYKDLYERFLADPEFRYVYGLIEDGKDIFSPGFGAATEEETRARQIAIERLFAHFEVICSLHNRGLLTSEDMRSFNYAIERLARHQGFSEYEAFLKDWTLRRGVSRGPYDTVFSYISSNLDV